MSEAQQAPAFPARRLAWSTAVFSAATGLSRVMGLVREIVVRRYFGVEGAGINAFTVAFQVPNLVRALVADAAISSAFVPVFSELLEKGERARAWRVASSLIWIMLLGLTAITAVFILAAPWVMSLFGYGSGEGSDLAVTLARILFPTVILLGISGIVVGILNSYEHFTIPALTPVFWNVAIIVGLLIGVPRAGSEDAALYVYAGSIVVGTVIQLFLPLPWLSGRDGRLRLAIDWRDPAVKRVFVLMLPVALGLGLINVNALIGTLFAARYIDPDLSRARSTQRSGSTCSRRACSPWRWRRYFSRRWLASPPARMSRAFAAPSRSACARSPSCSFPQASSQRCWPSRSSASSTSAASSARARQTSWQPLSPPSRSASSSTARC